MLFDWLTYGLLFLAGMLITLSPCILPVLPIMLASGLQKDRLAPIKTGLGLAVGFAVLGVIIVSLTIAVGLSQAQSKTFFAVLILLAGLALVLNGVSAKSSSFFQPLANWFDRMAMAIQDKKGGSFLLGLLLGGVWSPCVGPILGAAVGLTAGQGTIFHSGLQMFIFGLGAAFPLVIVAYFVKGTARRFLPAIAQGGEKVRRIMGYLLLVIGIYVITGLDTKTLAWLTEMMPQAWLDLVTMY